MKYLLFLFLLIPSILLAQTEKLRFGYSGQATDSKVFFKGVITTIASGPLPGASIVIKNTGQGTTTNENGQFALFLKPGEYELEITYVGMQAKHIELKLYTSAVTEIIMKEQDLEMDEIVITAQPDQNISSVFTGKEVLEIEEIKRLPTFLGEVDVIRSLQLLPGVNNSGEGSRGFNVRGGKYDQNLVLFNQSPIFNSSHLFGFFSAFNPGVVKNFTLYKGYIPAQFGGRAASVLDVDIREGNRDKFHLEGGVGTVASRLVIDGPINKKLTYLIGGRTSYSNWILQTVKNPDIHGSKANFYDFNAVINFFATDKSKLQASYYASHDNFKFANSFSFGWSNQTAGLEYRVALTDKIVSRTNLNIGTYKSDQLEPDGLDGASRTMGMKYYQGKQNFAIGSFLQHEINVGAEVQFTDVLPEVIIPKGPNTLKDSANIQRSNGLEFSLYADDTYKVSEKLTFAYGFRYTFFTGYGPNYQYVYQNNDYSSVDNITDTLHFSSNRKTISYQRPEPRFSMKYSLSQSSSIKLSYSRLNQYIQSIYNSISPTPTAIWQMSNQYTKPLQTDNYSIGYFKNLKDNKWEISVEAFYRHMNNIIDYRNFADLVGNDHLESSILSGKGKAYGLEVQVEKQGGSRWNGWISYTYSQALNNIPGVLTNGSKWYPNIVNRPHNFSLVSKLRIGKKSSLDGTFTFITGRPLTAPESVYYINNYGVPNFSQRNKYKIPNYIRLDIAVTIAENIWKHRKPGYENRRYKDTLTFSIYNLLGRKNAYSVYFVRPQGRASSIPEAYKFSVLGQVIPSFTYNFKF